MTEGPAKAGLSYFYFPIRAERKDETMARQMETIRIAKSETDKINISASRARNYLALTIANIRDNDIKKYKLSMQQLMQELVVLKDRCDRFIGVEIDA